MRLPKLLLFLIIVVVYILFFEKELLPEISLQPEWIEQLNGMAKSPTSYSGTSKPFKFSNRFGYFLTDGTILFSGRMLYNTAIDKQGFINYSSVNNKLLVHDAGGSIVSVVSVPGYPVFRGNRRFILYPDENHLAEIDIQGTIQWDVVFNSLITDIAVEGGLVFIGTLNDGAVLLGPDGEKLFTYIPDVSKVNVIYGVGLSPGGDTLVVVSGINPQVVTLLSKKENQYKKQYTVQLNSAIRHQVLCGFSSDGKTVLVERKQSVILLDVQKRKLRAVPFSGLLQTYYSEGISGPLYLVTEREGTVTFSLFTSSKVPVFSFSLLGGKPYFSAGTSSVFIGMNNRLMKLDIVEQ